MVRVKNPVRVITNRGPVGSKSSIHTGTCSLSCRSLPGKSGRVTFDIITHPPTNQLIDRYTKLLALDIPKGQVECPQCMQLFPPGWIEETSIHHLPKVLDAVRIFANKHACALLQ